VLDNGREFVGRALDARAYAHSVAVRFIRLGKPIENAYVESFNGRFGDECLNEHWFRSVAEAQALIEAWRIDYNTVRPHASLGQQTPSAYADACPGVEGLLGGAEGRDREQHTGRIQIIDVADLGGRSHSWSAS